MFDIGFSELLLTLVVALLVLGPKELPRIAHFLGATLRVLNKIIFRARQEVHKVMDEHL